MLMNALRTYCMYKLCGNTVCMCILVLFCKFAGRSLSLPHVFIGLLCHVMSADILHKIRMSPKPVGIETHSSSQSIQSSTQSIEQVEGAIEKLAFRFNQVSWPTE